MYTIKLHDSTERNGNKAAAEEAHPQKQNHDTHTEREREESEFGKTRRKRRKKIPRSSSPNTVF
jgi:hypothetical protein